MKDIWLTDRSRYTSGFQCPRYRYLKYHSGEYGYGMARTRTSIPLATGTYIHAALASMLEAEKAGGCDRTAARTAINTVLEQYAKEVTARPLNGIAPTAHDFIFEEQCCLIEGLCWAWFRIMLPIVREEFEIVTIEQEELYPISKNVYFMSKPDCILRRREDGELGNHDFKTAGTLTDKQIDDWQRSIQMVMGTLGAERRLNEPIPHFYMHALIKGYRAHFKKNREPIHEFKQVHSSLCYAKIIPPSPPATTHTTWATKGYWADKLPIWNADFSQRPAEMTNSEFWVMEALPEATLQEFFTLVGPYKRQLTMVPHFTTEMAAEEERWIKKLWTLYEAEKQHPWESPEFQRVLDENIPRSYDCTPFYSKCEMHSLCFFEEGWAKPIELDAYQHRRSHHSSENDQMASRGIVLPLQPWEEEEAE